MLEKDRNHLINGIEMLINSAIEFTVSSLNDETLFVNYHYNNSEFSGTYSEFESDLTYRINNDNIITPRLVCEFMNVTEIVTELILLGINKPLKFRFEIINNKPFLIVLGSNRVEVSSKDFISILDEEFIKEVKETFNLYSSKSYIKMISICPDMGLRFLLKAEFERTNTDVNMTFEQWIYNNNIYKMVHLTH